MIMSRASGLTVFGAGKCSEIRWPQGDLQSWYLSWLRLWQSPQVEFAYLLVLVMVATSCGMWDPDGTKKERI